MDLSNEIEKIILSKPGASTFSYNDVSELIGFTRDNTVFDLSKSIAKRDIDLSLRILLNILQSSNSETKIIAVLRDLFIKI